MRTRRVVLGTAEAPIRTLLVEDDPSDRALLEELVTARGHRVEAFDSGGEALKAYEARRHDLVLMDIRLNGELDGLELCRSIRKVPGSEDTIVLFVTGMDRPETLERALEAGADDYILKPVNGEAIGIRLTIAERQVGAVRKHKRVHDELSRNAIYDSVTGLASRSFLVERVEDAIERADRSKDFRFAVLDVNLDDFGPVNRAVGLAYGDALLHEAGQRLRDCVRGIDVVARVSADGFVIFLDGIHDLSDPVRVANRVHKLFEAPFQAGDRRVRLTAGVGIALSESGYETADAILRDAHRALRWAKADGPATSRMFDRQLHDQAAARVRMEDRIRGALDDGRMELWYQPILSVAESRIRAFEALIRMRTTEGELVPPGDFIPVAEESGLIVPLGWWTMEQAARQLAEWQERFPSDPPLCLAVNVSAKQFAESGIAGEIARRVTSHDLAPWTLHLEITETALMSELETTVGLLERLRSLNLRLHIDDFGTAYSSLSYLCRLPVDTLKIDRSFIAVMNESPQDREVVRAVVQLAHTLKMEVIGEGVETEEQLEGLRELGCDLYQGYLAHRPMPPENVETVMSDAVRVS